MSDFDSLFFPYRYGDTAIGIDLEEVQLDGERKDADIRSDQGRCVLTDLGDWSSARLLFSIAPPEALLDGFVPASEHGSARVDAVMTAQCGQTKKRWGIPIEWAPSSGQGRAELTFNRGDVRGTVEVRLHVIRSDDQSEDEALAKDTAARVMSSTTWTIVVDAPIRQPGVGLEPEWVDFASCSNPYLQQHSDLLFHVDFDQGEPRLLLNSGCDPDIKAILVHEAPHGKKAWLRDAIYAAIAVPAWVALVHEAHRTAPEDEDGSLSSGWQKDVLAAMAAVACPDETTDEAIATLRADLRDPEGGRGIHSRLPGLAALMPQISFHTRLERLPGVMTGA
jgi:hypothetical protein